MIVTPYPNYNPLHFSDESYIFTPCSFGSHSFDKLFYCNSLSTVRIDKSQDFPGGPVVKTELPLQGAQVWSMAGELRYQMPCGTAKKKKNNSQGSSHTNYHASKVCIPPTPKISCKEEIVDQRF